MKINKIFILTLCLCCLVFSTYADSSKYIRVAIIQDVKFLRLKVNGLYEIITPDSREILYRGKNLNTTVAAYKDGILIGKVSSDTDRILIKAVDTEAIIINGRRFRGDVQIIRKNNLNLSVVNHIELEDYIKGILYHEASHYWPIEALKAQAIVCRTYAVYQIEENRLKDYDVTSDIYSQVYGGRTSERYRTNEAVVETRGYTLTYKGKVFPTYYHATCAGHTEDASMLWNIDIGPLKGVPCNFCKESPHFKWHLDLSKDKLQDKLSNAGYKINKIKEILIKDRDRSSRIKNLSIVTVEKNIDISAKDFRNIIGPNIIRSTNFTVRMVDDDVVFEGLGWGHGVGLCQWGAYFMAKQGYTSEQILKYYYPQSEISLIVNR